MPETTPPQQPAPPTKSPPPSIVVPLSPSVTCSAAGLSDEYDLFSPGIDTPGHRPPGHPLQSKDVSKLNHEAIAFSHRGSLLICRCGQGHDERQCSLMLQELTLDFKNAAAPNDEAEGSNTGCCSCLPINKNNANKKTA